MKIALVTYNDQGRYTSTVENEDLKLLIFLRGKGLEINLEVWTNQQVNWKTYDLILLKSPWDYFDQFEKFLLWLDAIEELGIALLNPVDIVRWNADKHYLKDISDAGLPVTPSLFVEKNTVPKLNDYFAHFATDKLIIKPTVSGGSKNTFKFTEKDIAKFSPQIEDLLKNESFIIQPFLNEIADEGELSFLFFNGKFSHCLLKKAKAGDFRVQHTLGGTIHPQNPSEKLIAATSKYVEEFAKGCLYARVDGVINDCEFYLMELELIEPFLFLFTEEKSYENYYRALKDMMASR